MSINHLSSNATIRSSDYYPLTPSLKSDKRSGKRFDQKDLKIPDDIEDQLAKLKEIKRFKPLLKLVSDLVNGGGQVVVAKPPIIQPSDQKDSQIPDTRLKRLTSSDSYVIVPDGSDILIELDYIYKNGKLHIFYVPRIYIYNYNPDGSIRFKDGAERELHVTKSGLLVARYHRVSFKNKSGEITSFIKRDGFGKNKRAHEMAKMNGLLIEPRNSSRGVIIMKLTSLEAKKVNDDLNSLQMYEEAEQDFILDFYKAHKSEIYELFISELNEGLVKESVDEERSKSSLNKMSISIAEDIATRIVNRNLIILPSIINQDDISGEERFLVPEFITLIAMFLDEYHSKILTYAREIVTDTLATK